MEKLFFLSIIVLFMSCSEKEVIEPTPTPPGQPKPTVKIIVAPSSTVEHGDTVTVTCDTAHATSMPPVAKFRPVKDTTVYRTVYGPGGQATDSAKITVTIPQDATNLTSGPWKVFGIRRQNPDGTWTPYVLNHCDSVGTITFYLTFKEKNSCIIGQADWSWVTIGANKRGGISVGSDMYRVKQLDASTLVLEQDTPNYPAPGTTTYEITYKH